jgi:Transposase DNA-binding/Transposase Tn5 dimerisation domain
MVTPLLTHADSIELWASQVAAQADLPDERLNARLALILHTLASKPLDAFPQACATGTEAKGLYRFLENQRLDVEHFLQPLVDTTVDACRGLTTVLAIQDSSSANYATLRHTKGLGKLNDSDALGLHFHTTIAAQTDGVIRGLLHQSHWSRPPDEEPVAAPHQDKSIAAKESYKWLEGIEAAEAALDGLPADQRPRLLHIFDREGDIHEVLQRITGSPHGAVIRVAQKKRGVDGPLGNAGDTIASAPGLGVHIIDVPPQHGSKKRQARLELRSARVTITPNTSRYPHRQAVIWTLVEAKEIGAPAGVEPLHWLLWTTEAADTVADIVEVLRLYKLRWLVEDFHLTLKSGCQIEELRLETADRLIKALVLYSAVALRIVALRDLARQQPEAACTLVLTTEQWQVLYAYLQDQRPTSATPVPSIRQAVLWIGRLGGHLGRKSDGQPGVRVLWRGWRDLTVLLAGYRAARATR